jgi:hypothetical protein
MEPGGLRPSILQELLAGFRAGSPQGQRMLPRATRAIVACVDFSDLLGVTLSSNYEHFDEVLVVTAPPQPRMW